MTSEALVASMIGWLNILLPLLLIMTAIAALMIRNLMAATALMGIFSLLMALLYLMLSAPDVAITEAAVGAGVCTVFMLAAISICGVRDGGSSTNLLAPVLTICVIGAALVYASFDMPEFGDGAAPANAHLGLYYLQVSEQETGIPNVVTSVLASYRGFDTLGETCVVLAAAIACLLLLGKESAQEPEEKE